MKKKIENRKIVADGLVILDDNSLFETLFIDPKYIENSIANDSPAVREYNHWAKMYDLPAIRTEVGNIDHERNQLVWKMPKEYSELDIEKYILEKCNSEKEKNRVLIELKEFKERNLYNLLKYLVFLVKTMRENNIVYGIGRGSSVSSYVLYLIGIHRVDSLKYNLDISEFLK